ncbi:hypothetical protein [Pseudomonas sp. NPDC089741]|uniref:hypothetical protein n=1 Tax=Pseudomonas sp. NPDC089741 TaxID=3364470 RepID=UPI0037F38401
MRINRQKKPAEAGFYVSQAIKSLDLNGENGPCRRISEGAGKVVYFDALSMQLNKVMIPHIAG